MSEVRRDDPAGPGPGDAPGEIPLPPLCTGELTDDDLDALARDLDALARIEDVRVRPHGGPGPRARPTPLGPHGLLGALADLRAGRVAGVQVQYRHDGQTWLDTLTGAPDAWRLVRLAAPPGR